MAERHIINSMPSPRRRKLLLGAGALVALGVALSWPLLRRDDPEMIGAMLRELLPDLRIAPEELSAFSEDFLPFYQARNPRSRRVLLWGARALWAYLPGGGRRILPGVLTAPRRRLETELLIAFLMGTDYLEARTDENATVSYIALPDPYESGCPNVFARFD
ncbi:MAG: hypothetical protein HKP40_01425 [Litoreibacter sp.]|nr:hypothetical protein [Litoreibacter sp.]